MADRRGQSERGERQEDAVIFDGVWKSYPSYNRVNGGIKSFLFNLPEALRELKQRRPALTDVSFRIRRGECFGFIGRNGAGKSTTLGLIAGVLAPEKGSVTVNGRVSPLLALGAGFHPELSGRENILLNGVLLGLSKREVLALEEEVIAFSELSEFIEQPVRTYSSGMYAKLGFSVISVLKPEILLLDEVLAVGDIAFAGKCAAVIENFRNSRDVTIVMVSHGLTSVAELCDRAAWIEDRTVRMIGEAKEVVAAYEARHGATAGRPRAAAEADANLGIADGDAGVGAGGKGGGVWPAATTVRVVAPNVMPRDAVGDFAVRVAELYARNGIPARLYARASHPELAALVAPLDDLEAETKGTDTLFYHFSTEDEFLPRILALPFARKILYYHNVTPGRWFRESEPLVADLLDRAREQFPSLSAFDAVFANSSFSLGDIAPHIREDAPAVVLPPTLCVGRLAGLEAKPFALPKATRPLLWVGRLAPHKRPELALELFARLHALASDVVLVMVGGGRRDFPDYAAAMEARIAAMPRETREAVILAENLEDAQLAWLYRHCALLLCTSGHEGCCLPLAEAMSFGLPVAAFPQEAVEETLNGYGTILPPGNPDEDPGEAAAVLRGLLERGEKPDAVPIPPLSGEETARVLLRRLPGHAS